MGWHTHTRQNDFKAKTVTRDKERHYLVRKGSVQQENVTLVNTYIPNTGAPGSIRPILADTTAETRQ